MSSSNNNEAGGDRDRDRLSSLPDALLIEILRLVPIKSAAATSVLSHRWIHLWTHHTRLFFECHDPVKSQHFISTVEHILRQINSPKIHSFSLTLPSDLNLEVAQLCSRFLHYSLVPNICDRYPEDISVCLSLGFSCDILLFGFDLPVFFLQTESLVELTLRSDSTYFSFDGDAIICSLPNLKKLTMWMSLQKSQCSLLGTLSKSCPLLEYLDLTLCHPEGDDDDDDDDDDDGSVFEIFGRNVKYLALNLFNFDNSKLKIDTPKVERLKLEGGSTSYDFVTSPSNLVQVKMSLLFTRWAKHCLTNLFHGISSVRSLYLASDTLAIFNDIKYEHYYDDYSPSFPNLVRLKITCNLIIEDDMIRDAFIWDDALPTFLLTKIKSVEIPNIWNTDIGLDFIAHILRYGTVLEELSVSINHGEISSRKEQLWAEHHFCDLLFKISRTSSNCVIKFLGRYMTASTNDSDELPCNLELYM